MTIQPVSSWRPNEPSPFVLQLDTSELGGRPEEPRATHKRPLVDDPLLSPDDFPPAKAPRTTSPPVSTPPSDPPRPRPNLLTLPLPSQRFKKGSKNLLLPPELLLAYPLPPLLPIADPELRAKVFAHESLFDKEKGRFEEDPSGGGTERHYEKLEHVGDSILGMVVTTWLQKVHPRLTCGSATVS